MLGMMLFEKMKVVFLVIWLRKFFFFVWFEKDIYDFLGIFLIYVLFFRKVFFLVEGNVFFYVNFVVLFFNDSEIFVNSYVYYKIL